CPQTSNSCPCLRPSRTMKDEGGMMNHAALDLIHSSFIISHSSFPLGPIPARPCTLGREPSRWLRECACRSDHGAWFEDGQCAYRWFASRFLEDQCPTSASAVLLERPPVSYSPPENSAKRFRFRKARDVLDWASESPGVESRSLPDPAERRGLRPGDRPSAAALPRRAPAARARRMA